MPLGITVADTPPLVRRRTRLASYSTTNRSPPGASATLTGLSRPTAAPVPSLSPGVSEPASVDTVTPGMYSTTRPLGESGAGRDGHPAPAAPPAPWASTPPSPPPEAAPPAP